MGLSPVIIGRVDPLARPASISVAASGRTDLWNTNSDGLQQDTAIYEIYLWCVAANTVQLLLNGIAITGVYDFNDHQGITITGLHLSHPTVLTIVAGNSGKIVGHMRYHIGLREGRF